MIRDETYDVGIIGGGVIGLACAWRLAQSGAHVGVFERSAIGREASWAAGGMLAAQCEAAHYPPDDDASSRAAMFDLCLQSRALYPEFAAELADCTSIDIELSVNKPRDSDWREPGIKYLITREGDVAGEAFADQKQKGHRVEESSFGNREAFWLPDEGQVQNQRLVEALESAAHRAGATLHPHRPVQSVQIHDSGFTLLSPPHPQVFCHRLLNCAGAWSGALAGLPDGCVPPVRPVAGQVLAVRPTDLSRILRHILYSSDVYLVPRLSGWLLVGATMEEAGFEKKVTPEGAARLLQSAFSLVPELQDAVLEAQWAGLRPATPDGLPILGRTPVDNLFVATGHFRNGILLTPVTAQIMAECILHGRDVSEHFGIERFASPNKEQPEPELCVSH